MVPTTRVLPGEMDGLIFFSSPPAQSECSPKRQTRPGTKTWYSDLDKFICFVNLDSRVKCWKILTSLRLKNVMKEMDIICIGIRTVLETMVV